MTIKHWITLGTLAGCACSAAMAQAATQARVLSAVPVWQQVAVPQQMCEDVQVAGTAGSSGAGAVIGALIGGVAGNAMGHGGRHGPRGRYYSSNRGATTVIGALAGGMIGNSVESANSMTSYDTVRRCTQHMAYENRATAYDVTYEYAGQRYTTRMDRDPGRWMAVNVQPGSRNSYGHSTHTTTTQFSGPSGVYQSAPAGVTVTQNTFYSPPVVTSTVAPMVAPISSPMVAPTIVPIYVDSRPLYGPPPGYGYGPRPGWHRPPPPPHYWR